MILFSLNNKFQFTILNPRGPIFSPMRVEDRSLVKILKRLNKLTNYNYILAVIIDKNSIIFSLHKFVPNFIGMYTVHNATMETDHAVQQASTSFCRD